MKYRFLILAVVALTPIAFAADPVDSSADMPSSAKPSDSRPGGGGKMRDKMAEGLPPELRARFEAARDKAMQDPAIQELKKKADSASGEFRKAMRDAMMKADPGLAEILKERMGKKSRDGKEGKRPEPPGFANLSEGDRQKLMSAREIAMDDPAVQAAEAKKEAAKSPEERRAASEEFHKAMKEALLKADPSLAPVLEQLKPPKHDKPPMPPEE